MTSINFFEKILHIFSEIHQHFPNNILEKHGQLYSKFVHVVRIIYKKFS